MTSIFRIFFKIFLHIFFKPEQEIFSLSNGIEVVLIRNLNQNNSSLWFQFDAFSNFEAIRNWELLNIVHRSILSTPTSFENENLESFVETHDKKISLEEINQKYAFNLNSDDFKKLEEGVDILAAAVNSPMFTEDRIQRIRKELASDFEKSNDLSKTHDLIYSLALSHDLVEQNSTFSTPDSMKKSNITDLVKNFYNSEYKNTKKMKIVICSFKSIKTMRKLANKFSEITSSALEGSDIKLFTLKDAINRKYFGHIIQNTTISDEKILNLIISHPSQSAHYSKRALEYVYNVLYNPNDSLILHLSGYITELKLVFDTSNMLSNTINIYFKLTDCGADNIDEILAITQSFLINHSPNEEFFQMVANSLIKICKESLKSDNTFSIANAAILNILLRNSGSFQERFTKCEFDSTYLSEFFKTIANSKSWVALVSLKEISKDVKTYKLVEIPTFPVLNECSSFDDAWYKKIVYTDPIAINLNKNIDVSNTNISKELVIVHEMLDHGEYYYVSNANFAEDDIEVLIIFYGRVEPNSSSSLLLFLNTLIFRLQALLNKSPIPCSIVSNHATASTLPVLRINCKNKDLRRLIRWLAHTFKNLNPSKNEISEQIDSLSSDFQKAFQEFTSLNSVFRGFFNSLNKGGDLFTLWNNMKCSKPAFFPSYYVDISVVGKVNKSDVKHIYDQFKSTGKRDLKNAITSIKTNSPAKTHSTNIGAVLAFQLPEKNYSSFKDRIKLIVLSRLAAAFFHNYVRTEKNIAYGEDSGIDYLFDSVFIWFAAESSKDFSLVQKALEGFPKYCSDCLQKYDTKLFEDLKESLALSFSFNYDSFEGTKSFFANSRVLNYNSKTDLKDCKDFLSKLTIEDIVQTNVLSQPLIFYHTVPLSDPTNS